MRTTPNATREMKSAKERVDEKCVDLTETARAAEQKVASQAERANASELESAFTRRARRRARSKTRSIRNFQAWKRTRRRACGARELKHEKERMQNEISSLKHSVVSLEGAKASAQSKLETATMEKAALDERFNAETNARREVQDELNHTKKLLSKANQCAADEQQGGSRETPSTTPRRRGDNSTRFNARTRRRAMSWRDVDGNREHRQRRAKHPNSSAFTRGEEHARPREEELHQAMITRRHLHNTIQELKGTFASSVVFDRRPRTNARSTVRIYPSIARVNRGERLEIAPRTRRNRTISRLIESSPRVVIKGLRRGLSLVQSALDGYKVCIFTYGQTGSGKTYTMLGERAAASLIPRSMEQIFSSQALLESRV